MRHEYQAHTVWVQVDLVVSTPKRLVHLVKAKQIDLSAVEFLILDEADKLFEEGFLSHIDAVIHACSHPNIVSLSYNVVSSLSLHLIVPKPCT